MNKTTTIQLKHRVSGAVLFQCEVPDTTPTHQRVRYALETAIDAGANLRRADLRYVDFSSSPEIPPKFVAGEGSVDRIVSPLASEAAYKQLEKELAEAREELNAYRNGGLTEEILRRNDGCIKVGRGISFVLTSDINPKLT